MTGPCWVFGRKWTQSPCAPHELRHGGLTVQPAWGGPKLPTRSPGSEASGCCWNPHHWATRQQWWSFKVTSMKLGPEGSRAGKHHAGAWPHGEWHVQPHSCPDPGPPAPGQMGTDPALLLSAWTLARQFFPERTRLNIWRGRKGARVRLKDALDQPPAFFPQDSQRPIPRLTGGAPAGDTGGREACPRLTQREGWTPGWGPGRANHQPESHHG